MTDLLFYNGHIWTGDSDRPRVSALAVDSGRIVALGDEALALKGQAHEVIDLAGGMVIPGFADGHAHPLPAGEELVGIPVGDAASIEDVQRIVAEFAAAHPDEEWLRGGPYAPGLSADGDFDAAWLDQVVPDRPVVLSSADHHVIWVNSEALRRAGIDSDTPDPDGGLILRRDDNSPLGTLADTAMNLVTSAIPLKSVEQLADEITAATWEMAKAGITWVQVAGADLPDLPGYRSAYDDKRLPVRLGVALWISPAEWRDQLEPFTAAAAEFPNTPWLSLNSAKFLGDGAFGSATHPTAAMIEPYTTDCSWHGVAIWPHDELAAAAAAFDGAGFQLHIHGVGDAAVRAALDAIEHVASVNGERDRRPVVAHVIIAQKVDLGRFEELGAIPCMSPLWAQANEWTVKIITAPLDELRRELMYPIGSLQKSRVPLSFGSDWPVSSQKPLEGISTAITRQTPEGFPDGGWLPEQRISLDAALLAYTYGPPTRPSATMKQDSSAWVSWPTCASSSVTCTRSSRSRSPRFA